MWRFLFEKVIGNKRYLGFDEQQKAYFLSTWTANSHHVILIGFILNNFITPNCEKDYPFEWFYEQACFEKVDKRFILVAMLTSGYLSQDFYVQKYMVKDDSPLGRQMVWHHISGVVGIILGISAGFAMPGISNLCLFAEISTIFINYRSLYDKKDFGNFGPQLLQVIFFFTFTIFRMILMPCTLPYFLEDYKLSWDLRTGL